MTPSQKYKLSEIKKQINKGEVPIVKIKEGGEAIVLAVDGEKLHLDTMERKTFWKTVYEIQFL